VFFIELAEIELISEGARSAHKRKHRYAKRREERSGVVGGFSHEGQREPLRWYFPGEVDEPTSIAVGCDAHDGEVAARIFASLRAVHLCGCQGPHERQRNRYWRRQAHELQVLAHITHSFSPPLLIRGFR
jgi:hypothetical protein